VGTWYKPGGDLRPDDIAQEFTQILTGGVEKSPVVRKK